MAFQNKQNKQNRNGNGNGNGSQSAGRQFSRQQGQGQGQSQDNNQNRKNPTQEELCEHLTSKLRNFNNININTRKMENQQGVFYGIDVKNRSLSNYLNGVFHSLSMRTVSHTSRIINIKIVFNDDEQRNADIWINADAISQIFREIANTTKDNGEENQTLQAIHIEEFEDERHNKHLSVIAESVKGASLIYTYLKSMEFVKAINEKYASASAPATADYESSNENMTPDEIKTKKQLLEKELKVLEELENAKRNSVIASANDEVSTAPVLAPAPAPAPVSAEASPAPKAPTRNKAKYNNTKGQNKTNATNGTNQ